MSAEKRPADGYGSSQLVVKRANLGKDSKALVSGSGGNGALIQAVCVILEVQDIFAELR
jgi:Prp8 binding protein